MVFGRAKVRAVLKGFIIVWYSMGHKSYGFERVKHCMVFDQAKNQMGLNWLKIV